MKKPTNLLCLALSLMLSMGVAAAAEVAVEGLLPGAAILNIDGQRKMLRVGQSFRGVVLKASNDRRDCVTSSLRVMELSRNSNRLPSRLNRPRSTDMVPVTSGLSSLPAIRALRFRAASRPRCHRSCRGLPERSTSSTSTSISTCSTRSISYSCSPSVA